MLRVSRNRYCCYNIFENIYAIRNNNACHNNKKASFAADSFITKSSLSFSEPVPAAINAEEFIFILLYKCREVLSRSTYRFLFGLPVYNGDRDYSKLHVTSHSGCKYIQCSHSHCPLGPDCNTLGTPLRHCQSALQFPSDQSVLVKILTNTSTIKQNSDKTRTNLQQKCKMHFILMMQNISK